MVGVSDIAGVAPASPPVNEPVKEWFERGGGGAQYLTLPRSILEAMGTEWQERFVQALADLDAAYDWRPRGGRYWVELRDGRGRVAHDPLRECSPPDAPYIGGLKK